MPFTEISRRVSVAVLGYAVKKRGFKPEEVAAYAEILNRNIPDSYVSIDVLAEVVSSCPEYINKWLEAGLNHNNMLYRLNFYEALCEVLLERQPEQGELLFRQLHRESRLRLIDYTTKIPNLLFGLFRAGNSEDVCSLRKSLLENALCDDDLFEIAFLAQKHDKHEWLEETITAYLQSDFTLDTGKGFFLLGFMDDPSAGERLDAWIADKQPSWLHSCARKAKMVTTQPTFKPLDRINDRILCCRYEFQYSR